MWKKMLSTPSLCLSAIIAALYAALTVLLAPISYGNIQCRVSEALTILPVFLPQAIPGLTIGCLIANLLGSATPWDVIFGTLATLLAALGTWALRRRTVQLPLPVYKSGSLSAEHQPVPLLSALCPVVANAVIVGLVLSLTLGLPFLLTALEVGVGELVALLLGLILLPLFRAAVPQNLRESL